MSCCITLGVAEIKGNLRRACREAAVIGILICCFSNSQAAAAPSDYWRITMDRTTIVSSSSALQCQRLAGQLVAFEKVLSDLAGWEGDDLPPISLYKLSRPDAQRVFLSNSDIERQRKTNSRIYSKFLPGPGFNLAVIIDADGGGEEPLQSVLLLYAQSAMQIGANRGMPLWFQLGVPNILNGLLIQRDGTIVLNRNQAFEPVVDKQTQQVDYDLAKLLKAGNEVFSAEGNARRYVRKARDWAQFGLMTTDVRREQFRQLATLMRQGEPAEEAVQDAFGIPLTELAAQYEKGDWKKETRYRIPAPASSASVPAPTKLEAAEVEPLLQVVASRAQVDRPN